MSRNSANYLRAETTDGYLSFITNGRSIAVDNSNLVLNADKTSEFKGKLTVSSGGLTVSAGMTDLGASGGLDVATNSRCVDSPIQTQNSVFDQIAPFIPITSDRILMTGGIEIGSTRIVVAFARRYSSTVIHLYGWTVDTYSRDYVVLTDGNTSTVDAMLAW
jgi:hypothetical protein